MARFKIAETSIVVISGLQRDVEEAKRNGKYTCLHYMVEKPDGSLVHAQIARTDPTHIVTTSELSDGQVIWEAEWLYSIIAGELKRADYLAQDSRDRIKARETESDAERIARLEKELAEAKRTARKGI